MFAKHVCSVDDVVELDVCCSGCPPAHVVVEGSTVSLYVELPLSNFTTSFEYRAGLPVQTAADTVVFVGCAPGAMLLDMQFDDVVEWVVLTSSIFCDMSSPSASMSPATPIQSVSTARTRTPVSSEPLIRRASSGTPWAELLVPIFVTYGVVDALLVFLRYRMPRWLLFLVANM